MEREESRQKLSISLNKPLIKSLPGAVVGQNFRSLINMRHTKTHPKAIHGQSKVNTTAMDGEIVSGVQLKSDRYRTSDILAHLKNTDGTFDLMRFTVEPPGTGTFEAGSLYAGSSNCTAARFGEAPQDHIIICDGEHSLIWGGDEKSLGGFINFATDESFSYDFTDRVNNLSTDAHNVAPVSASPAGIDANVVLMLHFDNNLTDNSSIGHTITSSGLTYNTTDAMFGGYCAALDGSSSYLSVPNTSALSFADGVFTLDTWLMQDTLAEAIIAYAETDSSNYAQLRLTSGGGLVLEQAVSGASTTILATDDGVITAGEMAHVAVVEDGDKWYIFVNGKVKSYAQSATRLTDYGSTFYIGAAGAGTSAAAIYFDEMRVSTVARWVSDFTPPDEAYSESSTSPWFYFGVTRPIQGFKLYMKTPNTEESTMTVEYWDGEAWAEVQNLVDGTSSGGISLAQTGEVSFDSTEVSANIKIINGTVLYWYRVNITDADTATTIYHVSANCPVQSIKDIWDGSYREILTFVFYDGSNNEYTTNVYENEYDSGDSSTYAVIGGLTSSQYLLMGFEDQMIGVEINVVPDYANGTTAEMTVEYWDGSEWQDVGVIDDGTSSDGISLAQTGTVFWDPPSRASEFQTKVTKGTLLNYYRISFSAAISANARLYYIAGIPSQLDVPAHKFSFHAQSRAWLCSEVNGKKNKVRCSAYGTVDVWNGDDSASFEFGNDGEIVAGCGLFAQFGSSLFSMCIFMKKSELWAIVGTSPDDWVSYNVSMSIGCIAPKSLATVSIGKEVGGSLSRHVAIWLAVDGIYVFDGRAATKISEPLDNYFSESTDERIPYSMIGESQGFMDFKRMEYHILFASGSSATALNKEFVYSLNQEKWFEIDRATGNRIAFGMNVSDFDGNAFCYGANGGALFRLENGNTINGDSISATFRTGDISLTDDLSTETVIRKVMLLTTAKETDSTISATHYVDGNKTGVTIEGGISQGRSGFEFAKAEKSLPAKGAGILHSFEFTVSGTTDNVCFEPMFLLVVFQQVRQA